MSGFVVGPLRAAIFALAHLMGGSLGAGILSVSALLRLTLLPLTLRLSRRQAAQQLLLRSLKPELAVLNSTYAKEPEALWRETQALYRRAGYRPADPVVLLGNLARVPIFGGLYGALRAIPAGSAFAWMLDLARPNAVLAFLVATTSGIAGYLSSQAGGANARSAAMLAGVGVAVAMAFFVHFSSALVLSWGANALVDVVQGAVLLRERTDGAGAAATRTCRHE